ncbi:type II secretion system protein [Stenotrophomonas sp.]|uniref:type II secretion system protein n=1 Tax=Stenotrophomonas sp. TaxID=69392 RepID=UPI0028A7DC39|nr:type II secretion system protein [Stenotrophomonas sp.]
MTIHRHAQRGFSLVEMAIALVIAGLISAVVFALIPAGTQVLKADNDEQRMAQAEHALLGYLRANLKLPAADTDGDGRANPGQTAGWLPVRDLGLSSDTRILYQVQADLLPTLGSHFSPRIPDGTATNPTSPINGLDLCLRLMDLQKTAPKLPGIEFAAAYALAINNHRADVGADVGSAAIAFHLPGLPDNAHRLTQAAGIGELSSRLSCSDRVGRAQGAAQSAAAAYSTARVAEFNARFRKFDERTARALKAATDAGMAAAGAALAFAIFDETIAAVMTTPGDFETPLKITIALGEHANALTGIGYASYLVHLATGEVEEAEAALQAAKQAKEIAATQWQKASAASQAAKQSAIALDSAGIDK